MWIIFESGEVLCLQKIEWKLEEKRAKDDAHGKEQHEERNDGKYAQQKYKMKNSNLLSNALNATKTYDPYRKR